MGVGGSEKIEFIGCGFFRVGPRLLTHTTSTLYLLHQRNGSTYQALPRVRVPPPPDGGGPLDAGP